MRFTYQIYICTISVRCQPEYEHEGLEINPLTPNDPYGGRAAPLTS